MSEQQSTTTRNPSGYGEDATVLAVFGSIGAYLASLVPDPNLTQAIVIASAILGQIAATRLRNYLGDSIVGALGGRPAKGTIVSLALILCVSSFACGDLTVAECQSRADQARAGALGCVYFPEEPDRAKCVAAADAAVAISRLGCEWADRPVADEPDDQVADPA